MGLFAHVLLIVMIVKSQAGLQVASSGNQETVSCEQDVIVDKLKIILSDYLEMVNTEVSNIKNQVDELKDIVIDIKETVSSELGDTTRKVDKLHAAFSGNQEIVSSEVEDTKLKVNELQVAVSALGKLLNIDTSPMDNSGETDAFVTTTEGVTYPKDCSDIFAFRASVSGVYFLRPQNHGQAFKVFCDMETDGGGRTIAKMVSFKGPYGGYVSRTPYDLNGDSDMIFRFRTNEPDGVMIYASNADKSEFVAVMIFSSYVLVVADSGNDRIEVQSFQAGYNDGEWHSVYVSKTGRKLTLIVDDNDSPFKRFQKRSMQTDAFFLIGGFPRNDFILADILPITNNFIGCISDLALGFEAVSFSDQIISDNNANLNFCSIGSILPTEASSITTGPAQGTIPTTPSATTQGPKSRACALPRVADAGQQLAENNTAQQFGITEQTRLEFPALDQEYKRYLEMQVELKTAVRNGLIMFTTDTRHIDYVGVFMREGKVVFGWDYGSGPMLLESPDPINDGNWHTVRMNRAGAVGELYIAGQLVIKGEIGGSNRFLRTTTPIYIGGVDPEVRHAMKDDKVDPASRVSFVGCLHNFLLDGVSLGDPEENIEVQPCTLLEPGVFFGSEGGYVRQTSSFSVGENFDMRMSIKPRVSTAILMSVQNPSGDFLSMEVVDGVLFLTAENGDGRTNAAYSPPEGSTYLCDGNWHDIQAIKEGHILQLVVDGYPGPRAEGSPNAIACNTRHPLYFGGLPDDPETEHQGISTSEKFVGCMRDVTIRGDLQNFNEAAEIEGDVNTMSCLAL